MIGTDQEAYLEQGSISSFDIGDCITVFAIEKKDNKRTALIGWHIGNGESVHSLKKQFKEYVYDDLKYEIYIIGGTEITTGPEGCLLERIYGAINEVYNEDSVIKKELVNLNKNNDFQFVSANLHLDGTLTICHHNMRHD
jgi:hypothetical protein